jgi:hypothetical protein
MKTIINKKQLAVYEKYSGDIDGMSRMNNQLEFEVFEGQMSTIWSIITNKLQDIDLINGKLCSKEYSVNTLKDLKEICDAETCEIFMSKINVY